MDKRTSWSIRRADDILEGDRWVFATLCGTLLPAWLQATTSEGHWVQFDPDGPFRLVDEVQKEA